MVSLPGTKHLKWVIAKGLNAQLKLPLPGFLEMRAVPACWPLAHRLGEENGRLFSLAVLPHVFQGCSVVFLFCQTGFVP